MISIRKYLDGTANLGEGSSAPPCASENSGDLRDPLHVALDAYHSALAGMGVASVAACPAEGPALQSKLGEIAHTLSDRPTADSIAKADSGVQTELRDWGCRTARHYLAKAEEVKELLLAMARIAESVGERDERYARQIEGVTRNLDRIATLDDITEVRQSIHRSAADLKESIDRMTAESRTVLERMQTQIATFRAKLEEAAQTASTDSLTGLRSRAWVEGRMEHRIAAATTFSIAILDLDDFKGVNDRFGHVAGDALLKQFAAELKSACRITDIVARWGGDEFLILMDSGYDQAAAQLDRVHEWVCGGYSVDTSTGARKLDLSVSIGLAEWTPPEPLQQLLGRADFAMYERKAEARCRRVATTS